MNKFEEKYLECKKKWQQQGLKIKSLEHLKYRDVVDTFDDPVIATSNPRCFDSKHVWFQTMKVDLTDDKILTNECNHGMKILTIEGWVSFIANRTCVNSLQATEVHTYPHPYSISDTAHMDESPPNNRPNITNRGLEIETNETIFR